MHINNNILHTFRQAIQQLAPRKIFLVRGHQSFETCGGKAFFEQAIEGMEVEVCAFSDFKENPVFGDFEKGLALARAFSPDLIVALGGGGVLDMGKLIRLCLAYSGNPMEGVFTQTHPLVPLYALPTTAGSGSEATQFVVMYHHKKKYSVTHEKLMPDEVFINPAFALTTPPYLRACAGIDALIQAIEAYWSMRATAQSDEYAAKAIRMIYPVLSRIVQHPTLEDMARMMEGVYWSGLALNTTRTTAPHAYCYGLTSHYGLPHGHAVALTFQFFVEINCRSEVVKRKFAEVGLPEEALYRAFWTNYITSLGLTNPLKEVDPQLIVGEVNMDRLSNNPVKLGKEVNEELIRFLEGK